MDVEIICAKCGKNAGVIRCENAKKMGRVYRIEKLEGATNNISGFSTSANPKKFSIIPFCNEKCKTEYLE